MNDLDVVERSEPVIGLRALGWVLTGARLLLTVVTAFIVPLAGFAIAGHGNITVPAEVAQPFTVVFGVPEGFSMDRDQFVVVADDRIAVRGNSAGALGEEGKYLADVDGVRAQVKLAGDDRDSRAVAIFMIGALLALAWVALLGLTRIVDSARRGSPFTVANVKRLRFLAAAVVALPLITFAGARTLDRTLDAVPSVRVHDVGPSIWWSLVVAVALLALSEVFREGARLHELELTTI